MANLKLILLIICSLVILISSKKKIEVHLESLCPDCQVFIAKSFIPFAKASQHELLADVIFYPYGNAKQTFDGKNWKFTCQHGANECFGNLIETCAVKKFSSEVGFKFLTCIEGALSYFGKDFTKTANYCLTNYPTEKTTLWNCVNSSEGNQLLHEVGLVLDNLQPPHQYVPWIVVDGVHDRAIEDEIIKNMLAYLCKGQTEVAGCKRVSEESNFLYEIFINFTK